jgi:hypothetical protein
MAILIENYDFLNGVVDKAYLKITGVNIDDLQKTLTVNCALFRNKATRNSLGKRPMEPYAIQISGQDYIDLMAKDENIKKCIYPCIKAKLIAESKSAIDDI